MPVESACCSNVSGLSRKLPVLELVFAHHERSLVHGFLYLHRHYVPQGSRFLATYRFIIR